MFVKRVQKEKGFYSIRIVESYRYGAHNKKVAQRNIKIVGQSNAEAQLQVLERTAKELILLMEKDRPALSLSKSKSKSTPTKYKDIPEAVLLRNIEEIQRVNNGIFDIFGDVYDQIGFDHLIGNTYKDGQWNNILKAMVLSRISNPDSKRKTAQVLSRDYLLNIPLEKFYRTMDRAVQCQEKAQVLVLNETTKIHGGKINVMLFDVTTLYFESTEDDELRKFGFSKDNKFKEVQVVLSLLTTEMGYPVGYKLFAGNMSEGKTLIENINEVKKRFNVKDVSLVADRAMFTEANLKEMESVGIIYVVACKLKSLDKKKKEMILTDNDFIASVIEEDLHWVKDYTHNERRLVVSYSSKRAERDKKQRERLVERLLKKAKNGKIKVGDLIQNNGSKRFINVNNQKAEMNLQKIADEARWDGLHGIITNDTQESSAKLLSRYRQLWRIEEAFRINKKDLKMRPIYHWKKERVEAHILICYMAFALSKFTLERINRNSETPIMLKNCIEELSKVESSVVKNLEGPDKNLYVIPARITPVQERIYASLAMERRRTPWIL